MGVGDTQATLGAATDASIYQGLLCGSSESKHWHEICPWQCCHYPLPEREETRDPRTGVQLLRTSRALDLQLLALPGRFHAAGYSSPPPLSCPTPLSPHQETPGPLHPPAQHALKFTLCPATASTRWPRPAATPSHQPQAPPGTSEAPQLGGVCSPTTT